VTRFPPEPSGYLHIGHAKAALLNQHFARMYSGKLLVRFDDTNPSKERDEFVESILSDTRALGLDWEKTTYTSDYFPQMLDLGRRMIKAGLMYADDTPVEQVRADVLLLVVEGGGHAACSMQERERERAAADGLHVQGLFKNPQTLPPPYLK
jgi:glutamyl/glutaminyl-tRNA synthetase